MFSFEITQEDIHQGLRRRANNCPVTIAVRRALNTYQVTTGPNGTMVGEEENYDSYTHSEELKWFIFLFDKGLTVKPGIYSMELVR